MEVSNEKKRCCEYGNIGRKIFLAAVMLAVGVIWLLDNLNIIPSGLFDTLISWQMMIVVIGGYLISLKRWVSGGLVATMGIAFLVSKIFGINIMFSKVFLPVSLIVVGLGIIISLFTERK